MERLVFFSFKMYGLDSRLKLLKDQIPQSLLGQGPAASTEENQRSWNMAGIDMTIPIILSHHSSSLTTTSLLRTWVICIAPKLSIVTRFQRSLVLESALCALYGRFREVTGPFLAKVIAKGIPAKFCYLQTQILQRFLKASLHFFAAFQLPLNLAPAEMLMDFLSAYVFQFHQELSYASRKNADHPEPKFHILEERVANVKLNLKYRFQASVEPFNMGSCGFSQGVKP